MVSFFKLIRWPNLLMVIVTLYLVRLVIIPSFENEIVLSGGLSDFYYALMVLSTTMVAAGGYIINDIRDLEMDKINRPRKYILQRKISVESARLYYYLLNSLAFLMISVVCIVNELYILIPIHPISMLLLWLYSTDFKCRPFVGNILISLLSAFILILGFIYHYASMDGISFSSIPDLLWWIILSYSLFSFLISWLREIFKDMEDRAGDQKNKCVTMATMWKRRRIKQFSYVLLALSFGVLTVLIIQLQQSTYFLFGSSLVIINIVMLFELLPQIYKARNKATYKRISNTTKIMLAGGLGLILLMLF